MLFRLLNSASRLREYQAKRVVTDKLFCCVIGLRTICQRARLEGLEPNDKVLRPKPGLRRTMRPKAFWLFLFTCVFSSSVDVQDNPSEARTVRLSGPVRQYSAMVFLFVCLFFFFFSFRLLPLHFLLGSRSLHRMLRVCSFDEVWEAAATESSGHVTRRLSRLVPCPFLVLEKKKYRKYISLHAAPVMCRVSCHRHETASTYDASPEASPVRLLFAHRSFPAPYGDGG